MSLVLESPRGNCVLGGINAVLSAVHRVCPVFHAGPGCCMQTSAGESGQAGGRSPYFLSSVSLPSSNMLEREVVFGEEEKLRTTIQGAVDIIDAEAYFILTGCTAGIIGDDIDSVVKEFRDEGHPVYAIDTPGFAGDDFLGYEVAFNTFLEQIVEDTGKKRGNLVNLFGVIPYHDPFWEGNLEELTRILNRLGLEVNTFFTGNQGIEHIRTSSEAVLNINISPWMLKKAEKVYEEKFGVPSIRFQGLPIGATDTSLFVRQVGEALGLDPELIEKVIEDEERYVYHFYEGAIGKLSWKRFAVVADTNTAVGMTRFLANDYSFTPMVTIVTDPVRGKEDQEKIRKQIQDLEFAVPPEVVFEGDYYEITQKLREYEDVTLLVGSSNEREYAMEKGIQINVAVYPITDRLIFNRTYAGYRGALTVVEDLYDNL